MKQWVVCFWHLLLLCTLLTGCEDGEERRARYAEKKPDPKPLEKEFVPPPPPLPKAGDKEKVDPAMVEYKGGDIAQITGLSGKKVMLVFYAPWCSKCADFRKSLVEYAEKEQGKCHIVTIDADKYPDLANEYGVQAVPKTILYVEGMRLRDMVGYVTAERLYGIIDKLLEADTVSQH